MKQWLWGGGDPWGEGAKCMHMSQEVEAICSDWETARQSSEDTGGSYHHPLKIPRESKGLGLGWMFPVWKKGFRD